MKLFPESPPLCLFYRVDTKEKTSNEQVLAFVPDVERLTCPTVYVLISAMLNRRFSLKLTAVIALTAPLCLTFCPHEGIAVSDLFCVTADNSHECENEEVVACEKESDEHSHEHHCEFDETHSHDFNFQQHESIVPGSSAVPLFAVARIDTPRDTTQVLADLADYTSVHERILQSVV